MTAAETKDKAPTRKQLLDEIETSLTMLASGWEVHPPHLDHPDEALALFRSMRAESEMQRIALGIARVLLNHAGGYPALSTLFVRAVMNVDERDLNVLWGEAEGRFKSFHSALDHIAMHLGLVKSPATNSPDATPTHGS